MTNSVYHKTTQALFCDLEWIFGCFSHELSDWWVILLVQSFLNLYLLLLQTGTVSRIVKPFAVNSAWTRQACCTEVSRIQLQVLVHMQVNYVEEQQHGYSGKQGGTHVPLLSQFNQCFSVLENWSGSHLIITILS